MKLFRSLCVRIVLVLALSVSLGSQMAQANSINDQSTATTSGDLTATVFSNVAAMWDVLVGVFGFQVTTSRPGEPCPHCFIVKGPR